MFFFLSLRPHSFGDKPLTKSQITTTHLVGTIEIQDNTQWHSQTTKKKTITSHPPPSPQKKNAKPDPTRLDPIIFHRIFITSRFICWWNVQNVLFLLFLIEGGQRASTMMDMYFNERAADENKNKGFINNYHDPLHIYINSWIQYLKKFFF